LLRFQPKKVLKGKVEHSIRGARLWKGLVIFQYSVSILLIVLTLVVQKQLKFLQDRDLGISLSQVLTVYAPAAKEEGYWNQVDLLRDQLKDSPLVSEITGHSYLPGESLRHVELFQLAGRDINDAVIMKYQPIDLEYFQLFDISFLAGQDFVPGVSTRRDGMVGDVILNEAAIQALGINTPDEAINRDIVLRHSFGALSNIRIRGVVRDYSQLALAESNFPMAFILGRDTHWSHDSEFISFKLSTSDIEASVNLVSEAYKKAFPEDSFQYFFADDSYNHAYQSHTRFGKLVGLFCLLSIGLAVFGLIGVSTHTVRKKLREIAIRKVHGASVLRIVKMLLGSVMALVVLGFAVAVPLCYFLSDLWLQNFADRISLSVEMLAIPLVSILVISIGTVLHHSLKAALINPINIIRDE
ncbi:MAG: FtsX-like permease family protein, partial [Cyclobacteriaceae bacterium]